MGDFASILAKYGEKYGINTNVGTKSNPSYSVGSGKFADIVSQYNDKYNFLGNVQKNRMRYDSAPVIDAGYINQYLRDHSDYWSRYGSGESHDSNINHRLDERRTAIDEWLGSSLADGTIDQEYYDQITGILGDIDSYVGLYQGQRDAGAYMNDWREWFDQSADALDGLDWSTGRAGGAFVDEAIAGFAERDAATRAWLEENRGRLGDDYYNAMMAELNSYGGYADELRTAYDRNAEYYNQWANQREYDISQMSADELRAQIDNIGVAEEDLAIVNDLLASNMPYSREYAQQDGRDMAVYDMVEQNREYIANKYGLTFSEDYGANYEQLSALVKRLEEGDSPVAYTTADGQNVTWQMLYDSRAASEDLQNRLDEYSQNADWEELSKGIDSYDDTLSDYDIIFGLQQSMMPYGRETAEASGVDMAQWEEIEEQRRYIEQKYGVDLHADIYENTRILGQLMEQTNPNVPGEKDFFDNLSYLTDEERQVLSYIYNTQGREAALAWHEGRERMYADRQSGVLAEVMAYYGQENPGWGSVGSVALGIGGSLEQISDMLDYAATGEVGHNSFSEASTALRSGTMQAVDWEIGNWDAFDFVYGTTMSGADSIVNATLFGPAAEVMLGLSAAASATNDALNRGMSNRQAFWTGITAGTFEAIFEHLSIGELRAMKEVASASGKEIAKNIAKSMLTNASEETLTEVANIVYDLIVNGDFSQYETTVRKYEDLGPEEAKRKAAIELGLQIAESGASGALMGVGFGVAGQTGPIIGNAIDASQYNKLPKDVRNSVKRLQGLGMERNAAIGSSITLHMSADAYGDQSGAYMAAFDPKQDAYAYAADFRKAYEIGKNNGNKEYLGKLSLNEAQQKIAYELGVAESRKASQEVKAPEVKEEELAYSVSDDGATIDSTGKKVTVNGFSSVGSKVTLELEGGKTIDAKEVSFGTADEAILYETIGQVAGAASTANHILKSYETAAKEGMSASDFAAGLRQAYDLGVSGQVAERQLGTYELAGKLPVAARSAAFSRGRAVGQYNATARQAVLEAKGRQVQGKREGAFHFDRKGRTFDSKRESSLKAMEALSKALGVDIYVYESYKEGGKRVYQDRGGKVKKAPNGFYDAQGIHIDLNAGNFGQGTMMFTVAHELTHFIKEWSPVKFRKLADLLVERYAEQGTSVRDLIDRQIVKAKENGRTIDRDTAFEEVVADSMETMLTQGDIGRFMAELKQQDRSLWEKVQDWFKVLIQKLQAVVEQYKGAKPETAEGQLVAQMEDFIQVLQQAYAEALVEAGENYRANEGNKKTTQEGGEKMQIREIIGQSGKSYGVGVYLDSNILTNVPTDQREAVVRGQLKKFGGRSFVAYDREGNPQEISVASFDRRFRNTRGRSVPVNEHITSFLRHPVKQEALVLVDEVITASTFDGKEKANHPHDWLDDNGNNQWDVWTVFLQEKNETVWKATLKVANSVDGEKILYELYPIEIVEAARKPGTSSTENTLPQQKPVVNLESKEKRSDRDAGAENVVKELEKQNAKLKEDVKDLRELLRLQGKLTHGQEFKKSSIDAAVRGLAKEAMATLDAEDRKQLHEMLKDFYRYIAADKELAWEGIMEKAGQIADFLMDRVNIKPQRDGYADEVLRQIRGTKVRLSDSQRAEVEKLYGYETYRRMLFGAGLYLSKDGMELDSFWHEQASEFPGTFTEDVYEGDQPAELLRIIDSMREGDDSMVMEYAFNHEAIRQGLIRAVYDSYWRVDNLKTVADRKQKEINEIRRKHTERMEALKEEQRQTVRDLKDKRRADIAAVRKEYQEKNRKQIDAMRERYKENRARTNEIRSAAHQRKAVEKAAKDLMDMLSRPTKEAHVPMALQAPLEKFLNSIDFSSKRALEGGELTIKDVAYTRALQEVRTAIAQQRTALEGAADGTFSLDVPKEFLDRIEQHINLINKATEGLDLTTGRVYEMTSDELKDLAFILKTINKAIRDIDKLHMAGAKARVSELAKSTVWEMGGRKPVKTEDGGAAMWANYTPTFAFERMGKAATQILDGLKQGQAKLARTAASVIKFSQETYTNKEVNEWENEIHEVKLDSGKTVKMTTAQVMSFYCLSRREQAKGHLNGGGIRMGNIGEGRKMIRQTEHFRLTQEDIAKINGLLTDRQRKVANELQRYMADVGGRLGNEISMARWDYMEMTDRDYFPIRSDSDIHDAKNPDQDKTNLWALLNKSFTKQVTPGANDAMIVSSVFDVFADHMSDMAEYNAFALPLVDAMKWYNYRETEKQENGQIKTIGVKKAINDKLGTAAGKYFIDLMTDINSSQKAGRYENFFGKLLSRSKAASVGWNLRVAIQQPTAILRASVYLDPRSLVKGTARLGMKKSAEEMKKYSGIALWKSLGYYDLNISRGVRDQIKGDTTLLDKINDAGMWLPGKVDEQTWARIWESCKEQVRRQQKLSGERLLEETAKLFEDVVYHTQVADSVLTRSSLMRSKSQTVKELTSFMAEPTLSVNLLLNAFQDYREGVSRGEKAKRTMKILFCGYVLSAMANAVFTAFADAARDDDEYEGYWDKFFQALLGEKFYDGNLFAELNPLEKIVFVRDVLSLLQGYEGAKNPFVELAESGIKLVQNIVKFFQGKGSLTAYGLIYQSLQVLGGFTGAAPANLLREATTIWNWTFGKWNNMMIHRYKTSPKESIRNAYESGAITKAEARDALVASGETIADAYYMIKGWDAGEKVGVYDDVYKAALSGEDIGAAVAEVVEHGGKTEKEVLSQLRKQIKKWYTDPESDTKITREQAQEMVDSYLGLDPEESAALVEEWTFELENGYSYDDIKHTYLDNEITAAEAKRVLIDRLGKTEKEADRRIQYWDYLRENRDSELTEYQVADFYEYAEPAEISKSVYEKYIKDTKGIEGEGTKARKMEVIDSLPLSAKQKDALYFAEGWAKSELPKAPWHQ